MAGAAVRNRLLENFLLEKPIQAAIKMYFSAIQMQTQMPYASQKCFFFSTTAIASEISTYNQKGESLGRKLNQNLGSSFRS